MNKEWYSFDVREEVLKDTKHFCAEHGIVLPIDIQINNLSTSALMDISFLQAYFDVHTAKLLKDFVQNRYFYYRGNKYGNQAYWRSATKERDVGYRGQWLSFIDALLHKYVYAGNKILFIGTANGAEIPDNDEYEYYALEQLSASVKQLESDKKRVCKAFIGSFEDESLIIDHAKSMSSILALRCLTPNCRLSHFVSFLNNNLDDHGTLIISYPLSYINAEGVLNPLPNITDQLQVFEYRIHEELVEKNGMQVIDNFHSTIEEFYILAFSKAEKENERKNWKGGTEYEDIFNQYAVQ